MSQTSIHVTWHRPVKSAGRNTNCPERCREYGGLYRPDDPEVGEHHRVVDALEKSEQDVDVGLEDVAAEDGEGGDVVLVVQHGGGVVAEHQGRPDDEEDAEEGDDEAEEVEQAAGLLEEDPGEDDGEYGRGGGDHVGVGDGHVLEGEEVDDDVTGTEYAPQK